MRPLLGALGWLALCSATVRAAPLPQDPAKPYKRLHQSALDLLGRDKKKTLLRLLDGADPLRGDAESQLFRAAVAGLRGEAGKARELVDGALVLGLPPGRLWAGPGVLTDPLADVRGDEPLLVHGPMVGAVTDGGVRLWLRTARRHEVEVLAYEAAAPDRVVARAEGVADVAQSFAVTVSLEGLRPATDYVARVDIGGHRAAEFATFRTAPAPGEGVRLSFAFGGGAGYAPVHEGIWGVIHGQRPDLMLLLGDNVYIDAPKDPVRQHYCYVRRQSVPGFRALVGSASTLAIWDDHDFALDDCAGGPEVDHPKWKRSVWELFRGQWANPPYGGGALRPGCFFSHQVGDVRFLFLDGRMYRTDPSETKPRKRSMLGAFQMGWLEQQLAATRTVGARVTFLVSPVAFDDRAKPGSDDTWSGFVAERDRVLGMLHEYRVPGVVLVSADRHRSDMWRMARDGAYDLYELSSSRLTNENGHQTLSGAVVPCDHGPSFGFVTVDTLCDDPFVRFSIRDVAGEEQGTGTMFLADMVYR